jgi:hypothetical protein
MSAPNCPPDNQVRAVLHHDAANALDDVWSEVFDRPSSKTVRPVGRDVFRRPVQPANFPRFSANTRSRYRSPAAAQQQIESLAVRRNDDFSHGLVGTRPVHPP